MANSLIAFLSLFIFIFWRPEGNTRIYSRIRNAAFAHNIISRSFFYLGGLVLPARFDRPFYSLLINVGWYPMVVGYHRAIAQEK